MPAIRPDHLKSYLIVCRVRIAKDILCHSVPTLKESQVGRIYSTNIIRQSLMARCDLKTTQSPFTKISSDQFSMQGFHKTMLNGQEIVS